MIMVIVYFYVFHNLKNILKDSIYKVFLQEVLLCQALNNTFYKCIPESLVK